MKKPVLDGRIGDDLHRQLSALARTYTPEWRLEDTKDDPGAAIAALFCRMLQQSIDRLNAVPDRWYIAFLNGIGFRLLPPTPAAGLMYFAPYDMVTQPVTVPAGTQVFTPDADGENIVYETTRTIQATSAKLTDIYYADSALDRIERLDLSRPQPFLRLVHKTCSDIVFGSVSPMSCAWMGRQVLRWNCGRRYAVMKYKPPNGWRK